MARPENSIITAVGAAWEPSHPAHGPAGTGHCSCWAQATTGRSTDTPPSHWSWSHFILVVVLTSQAESQSTQIKTVLFPSGDNEEKELVHYYHRGHNAFAFLPHNSSL